MSIKRTRSIIDQKRIAAIRGLSIIFGLLVITYFIIIFYVMAIDNDSKTKLLRPVLIALSISPICYMLSIASLEGCENRIKRLLIFLAIIYFMGIVVINYNLYSKHVVFLGDISKNHKHILTTIVTIFIGIDSFCYYGFKIGNEWEDWTVFVGIFLAPILGLFTLLLLFDTNNNSYSSGSGSSASNSQGTYDSGYRKIGESCGADIYEDNDHKKYSSFDNGKTMERHTVNINGSEIELFYVSFNLYKDDYGNYYESTDGGQTVVRKKSPWE